MHAKVEQETTITGRVKWFDTTRGFGFIVADACESDILLHANVLRSFGRTSVATGAKVTAEVRQTERGCHATRIVDISIPEQGNGREVFDRLYAESGDSPPRIDNTLRPARVKWFDRAKGFGFANTFGEADDVFIHVEVLHACGLADLQSGEAIALRVAEGPKGRMAWDVRVWDHALKEDEQ